MPYPFAHPALAVPLHSLMGRHGVPSALAIGCIVPDLWHFVPLATRAHTHSAAGLLWFCLPLALALYAAFHLLLKRPLLALLPEALAQRAAVYATPGLPAASWGAVALSALAGAASHLLWDQFTHGPGTAHRVLQHASTLLGTLFLAAWAWRKLRAAHAPAERTPLPSHWRWTILLALAAVSAAAGAGAALEHLPLAGIDPEALRPLARASGLTAAKALASALLAYCLLWTLAARLRSASRGVPRNQHR